MVDEITKVEGTVKTEVTNVVKTITPSLLSKVGNFFSNLWSKLLNLESVINTKIGNLKTITALLIGAAGVVGAIFLELTGALRLLVIVPTIVTAVGAAGKFLIDVLVWVVSGSVSILQILLPLLIVAVSVYVIVDSLNKKK